MNEDRATGLFGSDWDDNFHSQPGFKPDKALRIHIGFNFGNPNQKQACAMFQILSNERVMVIDEIVARESGAMTFAQQVEAHLAERYPHWKDNAEMIVGAAKVNKQTHGETLSQIFYDSKGNIGPAHLRVIHDLMTRLLDRQPRLLISPENCPILRRALAGGYRRKEYPDTILSQEEEIYSKVTDALAAGLTDARVDSWFPRDKTSIGR